MPTGYIVLSRFKKAALETKAALEELKRQGAERIILDLGESRGLLNEAINICNFVPKNEVIVTTKSRIENTTIPITTFEPVDTEIPLVI
jgi:carboxyl-terminal processing protease